LLTSTEPRRPLKTALPAAAAAGLYVHVPFCSIKCFYCDFTAFSGQGAQVDRYLKALELEAGLRPDLSPRTLYVGGGTPSELSCSQMERLFGLLAARFGPIKRFSESTFETSPESLDREKLLLLREQGVSRLSIGLQCAEDRLLAGIGRKHSYADFLRIYAAAVEQGFSVNVDLMLGLPEQSFPDALEGVRRIIDLEPDHLSVYMLKVEDKTLFSKRKVCADDGLSREMMEAACEKLAAAGYRHYEISNFARPGRESVHNLNYWGNGAYLGLGCGASGYLEGLRYSNEDRLVAYCGKLEAGELPTASSERLEGRERVGEDLMLGLRLIDGMTLTQTQEECFRDPLASLESRGLLRLERDDAGRIRLARLTREGLFMGNEVFREFVAPFENTAARSLT
jgi:oxygen-independent coproporphyrinogen-3 oxidase